MKSPFLTIIILIIAPLLCVAQTNQKRLALVIGNSHYQFTNALKNPVNDSRAIAASLQGLGFDVMEHEDVTQAQLKQAINNFGQKLKDYDVGLFYYAGHGVQSKGVNYMIPVEAELKNEEQIEFDCVAADRVLAFMETASTKVNLIILDCLPQQPVWKKLAAKCSWRWISDDGCAKRFAYCIRNIAGKNCIRWCFVKRSLYKCFIEIHEESFLDH